MGLRAYVSTACGCPYEGAVAVGAVTRWSSSCIALGVAEISLGDTIGVGVPSQVRALVAAVAGVVPLERVALHLHDTYGRALANVAAGYEAGVRTFDSALGGLGGCPYAPGASGNVATEDVVDLFESSGVATGVSLDALVDTSALARETRAEAPAAGPGLPRRARARERAQEREVGEVKREKDALERLEQIRRGGDAKYHEKARGEGKLFCRERLALLLDADSFVEDAAFANSLAGDLPADGVVTGSGRIDGRPVCVMANDSTVKAGSWGKRTVEKILRIQERAERTGVPLVYLVDSAGARITDQIEMFPGRRGAGRIFHNQVRMSGRVPQVCLLFGPSAAGGAYIPAFCDIVVMVEGNASMYLGSPRMVAKVIAQETTLEEMGGARMHCTTSGCGDILVADRARGDRGRARLSLVSAARAATPSRRRAPRSAPVASCDDLEAQIPAQENKPFDMLRVIERLIDADSLFEIKPLFAKELITGFARIDGRPVGIVANQPKAKGGVLFVDSADKAARFIWLCDAFGLPIVFLADVPGFMVGVAGGAAGDHPRGREDDPRGVVGDRAALLDHRAQGLRRGALRDERPRLRARGDARAAGRDDRGDGARGGRERGLLQQARGAARGGARGRGGAAARRVPRGHRHRAARERARRGRRGAAPRAAQRARRAAARGVGPPRSAAAQAPQRDAGVGRIIGARAIAFRAAVHWYAICTSYLDRRPGAWLRPDERPDSRKSHNSPSRATTAGASSPLRAWRSSSTRRTTTARSPTRSRAPSVRSRSSAGTSTAARG